VKAAGFVLGQNWGRRSTSWGTGSTPGTAGEHDLRQTIDEVADISLEMYISISWRDSRQSRRCSTDSGRTPVLPVPYLHYGPTLGRSGR